MRLVIRKGGKGAVRIPKILVLTWLYCAGCALDDLHALSPRLLQLVGKFDSLRFMDWTATNGTSRAKSASRSLRRALLTPQVNPESLCRRGRRT